jgi:putative transposase
VDDISRRLNYHALFTKLIPNSKMEEIRVATNKAWVLGDDRFKEKVDKLIARQVEPKSRGGDRRSELFKKKGNIKRV